MYVLDTDYMTRGMTLLTRNLVDFQSIPGISVEDWTVA
jgi:predicted nucleic acid-binding protein